MLHVVHGEVNFYRTNGSIPKLAKKIKPTNGSYIVADSETTGNHHCVKDNTDVELFEKDGILYMVNKQPTEVFCIDKSRHDTIEIPSGTWEIHPSQEYDYLSEEIRAVRD